MPWGWGQSSRDTGHVNARSLGVALVAALAVLGCGSDDGGAGGAGADTGVRVASFDFAESELVAELYAQVLEANDITVVRLGAIGPREVVAPALEQGRIDLVPEYLGTAAAHFGASTIDVAGLAAALEPRGLEPLEAVPAQDVNVFVTTEDFAAEHGLSTLSDLSAVAAGARFGGPVECPDRPLCLEGLESVYGLTFADFVPLRSLAVTAEALLRDEVQVALMFSTSAELSSGSFVVLDDDRGLQPPENLVPVVRSAVVERWGPPIEGALNTLVPGLTTSALQGMNRRVSDGEPVAAVAAAWLKTAGLVSN